MPENSLSAHMKLNSKEEKSKKDAFSDQIHELKNRLTVIYGLSDLIAYQLRQTIEKHVDLKKILPEDLLESIDMICEEIIKSKEVIYDLPPLND